MSLYEDEYYEEWRQRELKAHHNNVRKIRKFARIVAMTVLRMEKKPAVRIEFDYDAFRAELRQKKTQRGEPAGSVD